MHKMETETSKVDGRILEQLQIAAANQLITQMWQVDIPLAAGLLQTLLRYEEMCITLWKRTLASTKPQQEQEVEHKHLQIYKNGTLSERSHQAWSLAAARPSANRQSSTGSTLKCSPGCKLDRLHCCRTMCAATSELGMARC